MTAHTHPMPPHQSTFRLTEIELRELFRMHIRAIMGELPTQETIATMPVAEMTNKIEPHLNRLCDLFTQLKYLEPKQE
jgi:hypothetical protein